MQDATLDLPNQIERSADEARQLAGLPSASTVNQVVVLGMGGSGIAGDIVEAVASPQMTPEHSKTGLFRQETSTLQASRA